MTRAPDILTAALGHMQDRATTYDKPEGERSMPATVAAFNALTGHNLTAEQGWLFMTVLKLCRTQQGGHRPDNYEDGAAYFALMGEQAAVDRAVPVGGPISAEPQTFRPGEHPNDQSETLPGLPDGWTDIRAPRPPFALGVLLDLLMVNTQVISKAYEPSMLFPDVAAWRFTGTQVGDRWKYIGPTSKYFTEGGDYAVVSLGPRCVFFLDDIGQRHMWAIDLLPTKFEYCPFA